MNREEVLLVGATLVAVPAMIALEESFLYLVAPSELLELRALLRDSLDKPASTLAVITSLAAVIAVVVTGPLLDRAVARLPVRRKARDTKRASRLGVFLLTSSIAQLPALLAGLLLLFGAPAYPVLASVLASSLAIVAIALRCFVFS